MSNYELRMEALLTILLQETEYRTLQSLAEEVGVSRRSLQNYLTNIEKWLSRMNLQQSRIDTKPGRGVRLCTCAADRSLIAAMRGHTKIDTDTEAPNRRMQLLRQILFAGKEISVQSLMDQFYVSRATILDDLQWASEWLSEYGLNLYKIRGKGLQLDGNEAGYRNAVSAMIESEHSIGTDQIQTPLSGRLAACCSTQTIEAVTAIIHEAELKFDFLLSRDFRQKLIAHLSVAVDRIQKGTVLQQEYLSTETYDGYEQEAAQFIAGRISETFRIAVTPEEETYICMHLIGYNVFVRDTTALPLSTGTEHLAMQIIAAVERELHCPLSQNAALFWGVSNHLKTSVYRLKISKYSVDTAALELLPREQEIFAAIRSCADGYETAYDVRPDRRELLELTWLFLIAVQQHTRKLNTLLISDFDTQGRFGLLHELLRQQPWLLLTGSCPVQKLDRIDPREYDVVLSTEDLPGADFAYLNIGKLQPQQYGAAIEAFVLRHPRFIVH